MDIFDAIFVTPISSLGYVHCKIFKDPASDCTFYNLVIPNRGYAFNMERDMIQILEQNSCFPLGGHYACQCVLFLVF